MDFHWQQVKREAYASLYAKHISALVLHVKAGKKFMCPNFLLDQSVLDMSERCSQFLN